VGFEEIRERMLFIFVTVFMCSVIATAIFSLIFHDGLLSSMTVFEQLLIAALISLTCFVLYSQRQLGKWQMFVRYFIHMLIVVVVMSGAAILFEWGPSWNPALWPGFMGIVVLVYLAVVLLNLWYSNRLAIKFTNRLKDRYSSKR